MAAAKPHDNSPDAKALKRLLRQAAIFTSATIVESLGNYSAALPSAIKPIEPRLTVCARAFPVATAPRDNLDIHRAIYAARPGDVLVVSTGGEYEAGYWGDVMTHAARVQRLGGLIIDGCVRDVREIMTSRFPVFARGACIRGTTKRGGGKVGEPIMIGETRIATGDMVVGDRDGVVIVPHSEIARVIEAATVRVRHEAEILSKIQAGKTTLELHGWPVA
jgi:4-hydroxy-4-methyl-2-oxoglutarate aldolase